MHVIKNHLSKFLTTILIPLIASTVAWCQSDCARTHPDAQIFNNVGVIPLIARFNNDTTIDPPPASMRNAAGQWSDSCAEGAVPELTPSTNDPGPFSPRVLVRYHGGQVNTTICVSGGCACSFRITEENGVFAPGVIHLYNTDQNGADCMPFREETIVHELGHIMGLVHPEDPASCPGHIMFPFPSQTRRDNLDAACERAGQLWNTGSEPGGDVDPYENCPM